MRAQDNKKQAKYNEVIHLISHYGYNNIHNFRKKSTTELTQSGINGFIFDLALSSDSNKVKLITSRKDTLDFSLVCDSLRSFCQKDTSHVLTLFLNYQFDSSFLIQSFQKGNIYNNIWQGNFNAEMPTIGHLTKINKQLICFSYHKYNSSKQLIKYAWDYAVNPCNTDEIEPKFNGEFCNGNITNKLLYLSSYQTSEQTLPKVNVKVDTNQDPFFISHALNVWKNTGKVINFLVFDLYNRNYKGLRSHFNTQLNISGTISYNREPLQKVFWEGDFNAVTHGEYSFPVTLNDNVVLKPVSPGFRFIPEEIKIEDITKSITQNFIAVPLEIHHNMSAYFPFNEEIKDEGPQKFKVLNHGAKIVMDGKRNHVAEFDGKSYITIPEANTLGMSNSDFTVSAWIKLDRENTRNKRDFSIMGTKENYYRGGLHLQTRDNRPYFGFFSNDLWGNSHISPKRWYHVVWRYTKYNQEQAIFVNGKPDVSSLNHPAFVSNSNIYIGRSISQDNLYEGRIDDVIIWERALGEDEIWNLYQDISLDKGNVFINYLKRNKYWLAACLFITTVILLVFRRKKNASKPNSKPEISSISIQEQIPTKNTIRLFGDLQIIDQSGEDITNKFTPRLKQIFVYLIIKSKSSDQGVSSDEFIHEIWPGFDRKKAINNRGVSISKLRSLLELMDNITISNHQERWRIDLSESVYCDYYDCLNKLKSNLFNDREKLNAFLSIVQRGAFLHDCKDSSFDEIKGNFSNKVIDILTRLLSDFDLNQNPELVIQISDRILAADDVNEEALKYKIKALIVLRQVNQAKFLFKSFKEKHEEIYNEALNITFEELIH
ncbi:LamG-like jellyroll fold domain-containing protein [Labilibacter marinus]|uniref:LamG-like jellyroll fold domain-containing protein n=1 Tax=Labilibacter marinus TaxID=1477105 RepID=UPI001300D964|nr:LamG-like jellyroll fold domain-containing protein [Labilibacter marinus]